jgi:hypothetical protein
VRTPTLGAPDPAAIWKQGEIHPTPKICKISKKKEKYKTVLKIQKDETALKFLEVLYSIIQKMASKNSKKSRTF